MGITATLSVMGKIIIILLMFLGRVGPLTFGIILFTTGKSMDEKPAQTPQARATTTSLCDCEKFTGSAVSQSSRAGTGR